MYKKSNFLHWQPQESNLSQKNEEDGNNEMKRSSPYQLPSITVISVEGSARPILREYFTRMLEIDYSYLEIHGCPSSPITHKKM